MSGTNQGVVQKSVLDRSMTSSVPKIDYTKIPSADLKNLCRTLTAAMLEFYDDPKNREDFEQWRQNRSKEVDSSAKEKNNNPTVCAFGCGNSYTADCLQ